MASEFSLIVVRVFVRDWPEAVRFYSETVGIPVAFVDEELGWAQLDTGQGQLALERYTEETPGRTDPEEADLVGRFLGVSLAVADVYAKHEQLAARGVHFLAPPERMPWGGVLAHFRDPESNVLTLVGNAESA